MCEKEKKMKYDFELDLVNNNSLSWIIEQVKKDSVVLEFGPANGRLTKYLKETLNCKVYLVELDEEAGKEALQYGEELVIGDAEQYEWLERYRDIRFDAIIFADILEHLRDPEEILVQSKHLLKADGTILLSVPNLAHNSVLIDLLNNKFEYQSIGLLDNTHIHMFTKESLENMLRRAGLVVSGRYATYSRVGENEIVNSLEEVAGIDKSYWLSRPYGEVYQFVYSARKGREFLTQESNELPKQSLNYYAQLFRGVYPEEDNSTKEFLQNISGTNIFRFYNIEHGKKLRFDPFNGSCIIEIKRVNVNVAGKEEIVEVVRSNAAYEREGTYVFLTEDPIIELELLTEEKIDCLEIEINYLSVNEEQIRNNVKSMEKAAYVFESKEKYLKGLEEIQLQDSENKIKETESHLEQKRESLVAAEARIVKLSEEVEKMKEECDNMRKECELMRSAYEEKDRVLEQVLNSKSWRITRIFRRY